MGWRSRWLIRTIRTSRWGVVVCTHLHGQLYQVQPDPEQWCLIMHDSGRGGHQEGGLEQHLAGVGLSRHHNSITTR
ncbi:hypothetical protein F5B18DRAFT_604096 [Nemania serpens]|nr:hypothetical protein F5B18DRAFT_604096 [Nemania serpens]